MDNIEQKGIERFFTYIKKVGDCNIYTGHKDKDGYGIFYFFKKQRKAHRFSYYITNGAIKDGMVIDHLCRVRACVNPKHLRMVTNKQNSLENSLSVGAINSKKMLCKNGHPFDRKYGTKKVQRYCSICESAKTKRLGKKWRIEALKIKC